MNQLSRALALMAVAIVVTAVLLYVFRGSTRRDTPAVPAAPAVEKPVAEPARAEQPEPTVTRAEPTIEQPSSEVAVPDLPQAMIQPDQTVATVNGIAITGRDLLPFGSTAQQSVTPEMFEFLLNRAIERELILQEAEAQDVKLSPLQQSELARLRASLAAPDPNVIQDMQGREAKADLEFRHAEAMLLQTALLEKAGHSPPYVTADQAEDYYQSHKDTYGDLPTNDAERAGAWREIEQRIRQDLSPQLQEAYARALESYLQELKSGADITRQLPP
jgi:hypothetical protein